MTTTRIGSSLTPAESTPNASRTGGGMNHDTDGSPPDSAANKSHCSFNSRDTETTMDYSSSSSHDIKTLKTLSSSSIDQTQEFMVSKSGGKSLSFHCPPDAGCDGSGGGATGSRLGLDRRPSRVLQKKEMKRVAKRMFLKKISIFATVKIAQVLCAVYILVMTFSKYPIGLVDPTTGRIIDVTSEENTSNGLIMVNGSYRPVVATTITQMLCLAVSRASAFSMYPVMIAVFLSKCKACRSFLGRSPVSFHMIQDAHGLHEYAGRYIAVDVCFHAYAHAFRWAAQGNLSLLWKCPCGISGLIAVIATVLISVPMIYFRTEISYELRKGLHYLFYVFALALCFHVPVNAIPNGGFIAPVLGFCICLYTADALYVMFWMTEKVEKPTFQVLPMGVQISMPVSERFQNQNHQGGFAYVCLPWVDKNQWHAFSLFENPADHARREVFMQTAGNWTQTVHTALQRDTARPVWVQGPFESPFANGEWYDNQILVAMGIGITPALSVIQRHRGTRRINLVWAVRDAAMLEFFLDHMYLDHDGWNLIFYTGKTPLNPALEELNTNIRVLKQRPDLRTVLPNIIYGIESGMGLPERYVPSEMSRAKALLTDRIRELDEIEDMSTKDKLKDLNSLAWSCGFLFTELVNQLELEVSLTDTSVAGSTTDLDTSMDTSMEQSSFLDLGALPENATIVAEAGGDTVGLLDGMDSNGPSTPDEHLKASTCRGQGHWRSGSEVLNRIRKIGDSSPSPSRPRSWNSGRPSPSSATSSKIFPPPSARRLSSVTWSPSCGGPEGAPTATNERELWAKSRRSTKSSLANITQHMSEVLTASFKPWEKNKDAINYVRGLDKDSVMSTWGILYCGGSRNGVERELRCIAEEFHVAVNTEAFNF